MVKILKTVVVSHYLLICDFCALLVMFCASRSLQQNQFSRVRDIF